MRRLLIPAALLLAAGCGGGTGTTTPAYPSPASSQTASDEGYGRSTTKPPAGAVVKLADSKLGKIIVNADGMTLYLFEKDKNGTPACYDKCAEEWAPYVTQGDPAAADGADANLLKTVKRTDGTLQVVYGAWPLYTYEDDKKPGDVTGNDKDEFGGEWYALGAEGKQAEH